LLEQGSPETEMLIILTLSWKTLQCWRCRFETSVAGTESTVPGYRATGQLFICHAW